MKRQADLCIYSLRLLLDFEVRSKNALSVKVAQAPNVNGTGRRATF